MVIIKTEGGLMIEKNEKIFLGINLSDNTEKANYLARIFAIFYEELLKPWLETKGFDSIGRPTIYNENGETLHKTYDYTLKSKKTGKYFIVEAKCYLAWKNFTYLTLTNERLKKLLEEYGNQDNFCFFCNLGTKNKPYKKYKYKYKNIDDETSYPFNNSIGKILIWPKLKKDDVKKIKREYGFSYIFSIEDAINEIRHKGAKYMIYRNRVLKYKQWTEELFKALL